MRAGRYPEAWALERATIAARDPATRDDPSLPYHQRWVWDGRPFDGRDVLVRCYHGLGDTLQFARYLPALAVRARRVTLEVQPSLAPLLAHLADRVVGFDPANPLPPAECDLEITELPGTLELAPDAVPVPYIDPPASPTPGLIGLCYAAGDWDPERAISPRLLSPLCSAHRCVTLVAEPTALPVANPEGCPFDMVATAALVASVELVVTVDTMIAHLAGAMGRPTWLLLRAEPDWRWDPARRTTPWYPSMRLYAQPQPGDWAAVLAAVAADLGVSEHPKGEPLDGQPAHPHRPGLLGGTARQDHDPGDQARADRQPGGARQREARV